MEEMPEEKRGKKGMKDVEEFKELISVFSDKVPALIKGLIQSVFSVDAAADMGKAAATYYKELKAGGIPDEVAIKMTQDYIGTFTRISEFIRAASRGEHGRRHYGEDIAEDVEKAVRRKIKLKLGEDEKEEE
jgi:hypothetical protein